MKVYWANSFFSEADRVFNRRCARLLRKEGHDVFNPQEGKFNLKTMVSSAEIFNRDADAIRKSDVLVACIDQETIDCGVACEVGYAYALERAIIGLLTDIRQWRVGEGRLYKNPFVTGCILHRGEIVSSINDVLKVLRRKRGDP
jgi:nucleoside 2-deoxyribosyltransferase